MLVEPLFLICLDSKTSLSSYQIFFSPVTNIPSSSSKSEAPFLIQQHSQGANRGFCMLHPWLYHQKRPQGNIGAKQRKPRHNPASRIHSSVQLQLSTFCLTTITLWKWESWRNLQRKERLPPPSPAWNTSAVVSTCRRADRQLYELCARM